jgi:hypothetical protein
MLSHCPCHSVRGAKTVILAQYDLQERDVEFFAKMRRVDMYGPALFPYKFRWTNPPKRKMFVTKDECVLLYRLVVYLKKEHSGAEHGRPRKKVLVLSGNKKMARRLYVYLGTLISDGTLSFSADRLKLLDGDNQMGPWQDGFLMDPNGRAGDFDVLISTPVLQAGHSLDNNIHKVFALLYAKVGTHSAQHQQLERARPWPGMELIEAYVQPGIGGRKMANYERQLRLASQHPMSMLQEDHNRELCKVIADVECEKAETYNRHYYLFRLDKNWDIIEDGPTFTALDDPEKYGTFVKEWRLYLKEGREDVPNADILGIETGQVQGTEEDVVTVRTLWHELHPGKPFCETTLEFFKVWLLEGLPPEHNARTGHFPPPQHVSQVQVLRKLMPMATYPEEGPNLVVAGVPVDKPFIARIHKNMVKEVLVTDCDKGNFHNLFDRSVANYCSATVGKGSQTGIVLQVLRKLGIPYKKASRKRMEGHVSASQMYTIPVTSLETWLSLFLKWGGKQRDRHVILLQAHGLCPLPDNPYAKIIPRDTTRAYDANGQEAINH